MLLYTLRIRRTSPTPRRGIFSVEIERKESYRYLVTQGTDSAMWSEEVTLENFNTCRFSSPEHSVRQSIPRCRNCNTALCCCIHCASGESTSGKPKLTRIKNGFELAYPKVKELYRFEYISND